MVPRITPPFFRFTYAINGYIWRSGTKIQFSVSGRYFCFHHTDRDRKNIVREVVDDYVYDEYVSKGGNPRMATGEEDERVTQNETIGLGFYRGELLDKGKRISTFDVRFGRERI